MKLGAQLYTVSAFTQTPRDIERTFKRVAAIGYTCVQVSGTGEIAAEALRDIAQKYNLEIALTHINPARLLDDIDKVIEEHKIFGCTNIGIGSMPDRYRHNYEGVECFFEDFDESARKIADNGMKFHYHNHAFEFEKYGKNITAYDYMIEISDPKLWGFTFDTYWVHNGGVDVVSQLDKMKGRIDILHLKDMKIINGAGTMAAIYDGNMPFDAILAKAKELGIPYAMVEQDNCNGENPFAMLKLSFENLKNKL